MSQKLPEKALAVFVSDIHLQAKVPPMRSTEEDWYVAMARPLVVLNHIATTLKIPVICAGDIFTRWNSSPELINFAMDFLPDGMYAIPGQHDLPYHSIEQIEKSAFWTLVKAGKIRPINQELRIPIDPSLGCKRNEIILTGFSFGSKLEMAPTVEPAKIRIAVVHDYIWMKGHSYKDAPNGKNIHKMATRAKQGLWMGYDFVVFGDNHDGFVTQLFNTVVINCGTSIRRHSNEANYRPFFPILLPDGGIVKAYIDCRQDKCLVSAEIEEQEQQEIDTERLFSEMISLADKTVDFIEAIGRIVHRGQIDPEVGEILFSAIEDSQVTEVD